MRVKPVRSLRGLGSFVVLALLLVTVWPAAVWAQGPVTAAELLRFQEARVRGPGEVPRYPGANPTSVVAPQGLRVWSVDMVTPPDTVEDSLFASLALDSSGQPHIAYYDAIYSDGDLKYAHHDGSAWKVETVDSVGNVGGEPSLVLDRQGHPRIAYIDYTNRGLRYAQYSGSSWQIQLVDSVGETGYSASLALDPSDLPHIAYYSAYPDCDLKYASYNGSSWQIETVDTAGAVAYISLRMDSVSLPHISYVDWADSLLRYAHHDGTSWLLQSLTSASGSSSMAIDSLGYPHIAFGWGYTVYHAWWDGSSWHTEVAAGSGEGLSLALDAASQPHISYYGRNSNWIAYAWDDGAAWHVEKVDRAVISSPCTSLAMDAQARPHIGYVGNGETVYHAIKYAVLQSDLTDWSRLAFGSYRDMNWEVYAANGDGTSPVRLTYNSAADSRPEFNVRRHADCVRLEALREL